jgi:hypothetical protein
MIACGGSYKDAVDERVAAIRDEEALATPNHSMIAMEHWAAAGFKEQDAKKRAIAAKEAYKDALRLFNYGIRFMRRGAFVNEGARLRLLVVFQKHVIDHLAHEMAAEAAGAGG